MAEPKKTPAPKKKGTTALPAQGNRIGNPTESKGLRSLPNSGGNAKRSPTDKNRRPFKPAK
jgi:hypothetical protein